MPHTNELTNRNHKTDGITFHDVILYDWSQVARNVQ